MHVFFDQQIFVSQEHGGISRYFTELARALGEDGLAVHVFAGLSRNHYLPTLRQARGVSSRYRTRRDHLRINTSVARFSRLWARWHFARLRRQAAQLIYHATNYAVDPWMARRADATCLTVFDMIGELFCEPAQLARSLALKRQGLRLADAVFCISEQTRRDLLQLVPECPVNPHVTYLASSLPQPSPDDLTAADRHQPYFLLVGNRAGYKNGLAGIRAFAQLASADKTLRLVCFGGEPWTAEEEDVLAASGARARAERVTGADAALAGFYSQSLALLYPSRYEGFGLPVLEAMQLGCPVVTTRCGSIPEVAGDAAIYCPADDPGALATAAGRLALDAPWRQGWVKAGQAQAELFRWPLTAQQTKAGYTSALAERARRFSSNSSPL